MPDAEVLAGATVAVPGRRRDAGRLSVEDALAPFADALREQLPGPDDILRSARSRRKARLATTTGTVACALAALLLWWDPAYRSESFATAVGQRGEWSLPDGSRVSLNTGSRVQASWHLRSRRLRLEQGEATFQVAHAPWHDQAAWGERPFTVQAGGVTVLDIGTVFNVRRTASGAQVTVLKGRVRVSQAGGPDGGAATGAARELGAGETLAAQAAGALGRVQAADVARLTAWREGWLVLDNTPLADVVAEMQRHRPAAIQLPDDRIGELRISGQFDLDRLDQLIDLLPALAPVRVRRLEGGVVRIEAASR